MSLSRFSIPNYEKVFLEHWEHYNTKNGEVGCTYNDKEISSPTYTRLLFSNSVETFMNVQCNHILQLGAASGKFLEEFKKKGWNVVGYDYTSTSISSMVKKGIPCHQYNLDKNEYEDQLREDLSAPTNIFAVRLLEYLEPKALIVLLFDLIKHAKPGSVFFLSSAIDDRSDNPHHIKTLLPHNYVMSFFAPRTDMEILNHKKTVDMLPTAKNHVQDELMVIRKL